MKPKINLSLYAGLLLALSGAAFPLLQATAERHAAAAISALRIAQSQSPCQGLDQAECKMKGCTWVRATTVNGKPRKAHCRRKPKKRS